MVFIKTSSVIVRKLRIDLAPIAANFPALRASLVNCCARVRTELPPGYVCDCFFPRRGRQGRRFAAAFDRYDFDLGWVPNVGNAGTGFTFSAMGTQGDQCVRYENW